MVCIISKGYRDSPTDQHCQPVREVESQEGVKNWIANLEDPKIDLEKVPFSSRFLPLEPRRTTCTPPYQFAIEKTR